MMDVSSNHLFGHDSDGEPLSPSMIAAKANEKRIIARIKTHFQTGAPIYISSRLYGPAQTLRAKIIELDTYWHAITYCNINEFNIQLPAERENLSAFATSVCPEPTPPPSASQDDSQLQSYFSFPNAPQQQSTPTEEQPDKSQNSNPNASFTSESFF